jgi:serine/threonine protein kinase
LASLLDGGTTDDGLPYFVMEYIEATLPRVLRFEKPPRLGCVSGSSSRSASAVQYAHRNLVVHRDIKPGNILVGADGIPKLLDFGIAKLLNPELAGEAPTATGMAMTPSMPAPSRPAASASRPPPTCIPWASFSMSC